MQKKAQYTITLTIVSLLASLGVSSTFLLTKNTIREGAGCSHGGVV